MLYVDSSALLKRYVDEPDSARCEDLLLADPRWVTGRHTSVEVRRNLARALPQPAQAAALQAFAKDWRRFHVVELDAVTCERAGDIAQTTGVRTLDALHLAAAGRVGGGVRFLTFDVRQAQAARALGMAVVGL
ncbi:MAG: type II toxin-antitoxin system VapC family toxin [Deltaproteobacteria bacterium]|nr:type II toxin-antitoxin system VapC family toxin [Deltaproteobacteria bacterium]